MVIELELQKKSKFVDKDRLIGAIFGKTATLMVMVIMTISWHTQRSNFF